MTSKTQRVEAIFIKPENLTHPHDDFLDALKYLKIKERAWYNPIRWIKGKFKCFY